MTVPDPETDPVEEDDPPYGFWATLVGLPLQERRLLKRIERLIAVNATDQATLTEALVQLRAADTTVDTIEPAPFDQKSTRNHTAHPRKGPNP